MWWKFLTNWKTVIFPRRSLLYGFSKLVRSSVYLKHSTKNITIYVTTSTFWILTIIFCIISRSSRLAGTVNLQNINIFFPWFKFGVRPSQIVEGICEYECIRVDANNRQCLVLHLVFTATGCHILVYTSCILLYVHERPTNALIFFKLSFS
jgi:hypothetical protein